MKRETLEESQERRETLLKNIHERLEGVQDFKVTPIETVKEFGEMERKIAHSEEFVVKLVSKNSKISA